ncbi:MAG TPA: hypothetical protein VMU33_03060 [Burkholderiaceae bacterium]|nr:hypothetical protein [Burkholderiaceae bacterium]
MGNTTIWAAELDRRMSYKSKTLPNLKGYRLAMQVDDKVGDILKADRDGPRQQQAMVDDANKAMSELVGRVESGLRNLDSKYAAANDAARRSLVSDFEKMLDGEVKGLGIVLGGIPEKRWDAWVRTKKEYRMYRIKSAGSVAAGSIGVVAGVASMPAAVVTGGATLAFSIVGTVRSSISLAQTLCKLWIEAEAIQAKLVRSVDAMNEIYRRKGPQALGAGSVASTAVNTVLGLDLAPNLKTLSADCELWGNKLKGIDVNAGDAAAKAVELLDSTDRLEAQLKASKSKDAGKTLDKLRKMRTLIDKSLEACHAQSARCERGRELREKYEEIIAGLKAAEPKWAVVFDKLIPAAANLALAGASAGHGIAEAKDTYDVLKEVGGLGVEIASTVKELKD